MKYFYLFKEYAKVLWQSLGYVYKFDKRGTIVRFCILGLIPVVTNFSAIATARLADSMQQNFGTGVMSALIPIFFMIVLLEILNEIFSWFSRNSNYLWESNLRTLIGVERQKKKAQFTIPFIESADYAQMNDRIESTGAGFHAQTRLISDIPDLIKMTINIVFAVSILISFNIWYALIIFITIIPNILLLLNQAFALRNHVEQNLEYERVTGVYGGHFGNEVTLKEIKTFGVWEKFLNIFKVRKLEKQKDQYRVWEKYSNLRFGADILAMAAAFSIQYLILKDVVFGSLLIGQATLVTMQMIRFQTNMNTLGWFFPTQYENMVAARYIFLYLTSLENTETVGKNTPQKIDTEGVKFTDVSFTYPEIHFEEMEKLVDEIDFASKKYFGVEKHNFNSEKENKNSGFKLTIPSLTMLPGERVAIVGKNGQGKTTFLQLVLNLFRPTTGTVSIFGNNIKEMNQDDVHTYYSTLFQDYSQRNLRTDQYIGLSEIENPNLDRVKVAAKLAAADEFIEKWKDQYTQQLGIAFKGVKPSRGQWQKLALARAFYKDAPIIILDEPTSAIDAISAKKIFENMKNIDPNKILLFVCHNISDIPLVATRVLVFDQGQIVGDGTHKELLKTCEVYKELYESERGK